MNIGIIGYGKMGKDIFSLFFDKLPDAVFTVLEIADAEKNTAAVVKTLDKSLKRKKITQEQYDFKKTSFRFTDNVNDLKDCDIVIEAIFENIQAKQDIFGKLGAVVSENCLLLSNTSSLGISEVFKDIPHIERCFGLHFFYPVKLTGFVELNILPETSQEAIDRAKALVTAGGKKPVVFSGQYHIYLNQLLSCMVAHAIYMQKSAGVSVKEMSAALSPLFPVAGPFDVLDSVGLGLMGGNIENFRIERNKKLLTFGNEKMQEWIKSGCPTATLGFLDYMAENETDTGNDCGNAQLDMAAFVLNEAVNALEECGGDTETVFEAITDTLGLAEKPSYYCEKFGTEALFAALEKYAAETGFETYIHKDKSVWEKYFG
ncbi:MAG: 3-hydroxyacyl-CoA dehydrogenase family protein [Ruminococcus sp.]|nr:3-hydroxyacyl-CoA dehydrogenase family protein [Ruminococcus sp.]